MTIAGIDYSSRAIDVVLLEETTDHASWHRFELVGQDAFDRARAVRAAMPGSSFWDNVLACGIEDPRGYNAGSIYRVQGAVLSCLPRQMLVQPFPPSVWRKTVGLPGNASKDAVARFARSKMAVSRDGRAVHLDFAHECMTWPQDAFDAYSVAIATRTLLEREAA